jgi:hypothetical protein
MARGRQVVIQIVLLALLGLVGSLSRNAVAEDHPPAQVMLFGVFHFANPRLDQVKTDQLDVMTAENQAYLSGLAERIATFNPTVVMLEYDPAMQDTMLAKYQQYREGSLVLATNEVYQLGFRIARLAGLASVHSFDEQTIGWNAEPMFEYMKTSDPKAQRQMDEVYEKLTRETEAAHRTLSLQALLRKANDPAEDKFNKSLYLMTNEVGAGVNYAGADAAASWWHRNFRMYANIQQAARPGERVLVLGGQGHIAILRDLLALDELRKAVDVVPLL